MSLDPAWRTTTSRPPLVEAEIAKHVVGPLRDDPSLITVTHTPNAITTHLVTAEPHAALPPIVRVEGDRVVTKVVTADYGTVLAVLGGPAVVEIALHETVEQRDTYALAVEAVDAETRTHTLDAMQSFALPIVLAVIQQLGVVDEEPADEPAADDGGPS